MSANMEAELMPELCIGVDLGGTHVRMAMYRGLRAARARIVAGAGEESVPEPIFRRRELVGDVRDPGTLAERLARNVVELVAEANAAARVVHVGIGIAAMLRGHQGIVGNSPNLGWRDVPFGPMVQAQLARMFEETFAGVPGRARPGNVYLYNDVNAITYGEYALGAGIGADDVLGVYVGTGIGGGIVAGGRLIEGATNCAGEIGHFKVAYGDDAPLCGCGLRGCIEAFVGGVHLQERIRRELSRGAVSAAVRLAGGDPLLVQPSDLDLAAAEGDRYALDLYAELAPLLAATLANAINLLNPGRLILGGGVLSRTPVFREHVITALELGANRPLLDPLTIVDPVLDEDAGLIGSALLCCQGRP